MEANHCEPVEIIEDCTNNTNQINNEETEILKTVDSRNENGQCTCGRKVCGPNAIRYIQPPRPKSFKPEIVYVQPHGNLEVDTVYKQSYLAIDPSVAKQYRISPIIHKDNIVKTSAKMENQTTQSLSYQEHYCVKRTAPISPPPSRLLHTGSMQVVTTHKHDYVPKPTSVRHPILPKSNISKSCGSIEKRTTTSLSYAPIDICQNPPPMSMKPLFTYQRPDTKMETDTIQKLSYIPVCPPPKEKHPWAQKEKYCKPTKPMEKETTYKRSYMKNCEPIKAITMYPIPSLKIYGDSNFDNKTTYQKSYYQTSVERPQLIKPKSMLMLPRGKQDTSTIYTSSYPRHCINRPSPIIPIQSNLLSKGLMQTITTQKHDFVPMPYSKRSPKIPKNSIYKMDGSIEKNTVNQLSYMPPNMENFEPAKPIKPIGENSIPKGPMHSETTYKLSYFAVRPPLKECLPWAMKPKYQRPTTAMETDTIQKMSYGPPGKFVDGVGECSCEYAQQYLYENFTFPRAAIVN